MRSGHWESLDELRWLHESLCPIGERLIGRRLNPEPRVRAEWEPPVDLYETESELVIRADVPGVDPKGLVVTVLGRKILVSGDVPREPDAENRIYRRRDRHSGPFRLLVTLPTTVTDRLSVTVEGGVIEIRMSKVVLAPQ